MENNKFKIGDTVVLKSKKYEYDNAKILQQGENRWGGKEQTEDSVFISPIMVVTMLKPYKPQDNDKSKGITEDKLIKTNKVTCTWFNKMENKYAERDFPEDALEYASSVAYELAPIKLLKDTVGFVYMLMAKRVLEVLSDGIQVITHNINKEQKD